MCSILFGSFELLLEGRAEAKSIPQLFGKKYLVYNLLFQKPRGVDSRNRNILKYRNIQNIFK